MVEFRYNSTHFSLNFRWCWVASFIPWPLYTQANSPWHQLNRNLEWAPQPVWMLSKRKSLLPAGIWTTNPQPFIPQPSHCTDCAVLRTRKLKLKACKRVKEQFHIFLTLAQDECKWSASRSWSTLPSSPRPMTAKPVRTLWSRENSTGSYKNIFVFASILEAKCFVICRFI